MNSPVTPVVVGAVFVGGLSSRMGEDKATMIVAGVPLGQRSVDALTANSLTPVLLVGASDDHASGLLGTPVSDLWPGDGPVGALLTALHHGFLQGAAYVCVLACDLPNVDAEAVASLLGAFEAPNPALVTVDGMTAFPNGVWPVALLPQMESLFLDGADSFHELTSTFDFTSFEGGSAFLDVDLPEDVTPFL